MPRRMVLLVLFVMLSATLFAKPAAAQFQQPVTFTQQGWHAQGANLIYSSWQYAFRSFSFYGRCRRNWLYAGCRNSMSIEGSPSVLRNLVNWFPQTGPSQSLTTTQNFIVPIPLPRVGALAGEVVALTMNVAFNDVRLMPRSPGYDLEKFVLSRGPFRCKTVGQVLDIADRVLGGEMAVRYGLPNADALADIVRSINANYEFINYSTYIDRGYLIPNRPIGRPDPPHNPHVP